MHGITLLRIELFSATKVRRIGACHLEIGNCGATNGNINLLTPDMKMGCHIDSLSMVDIIVPNVLSFLCREANQGDDRDDFDRMEMEMMNTNCKK